MMKVHQQQNIYDEQGIYDEIIVLISFTDCEPPNRHVHCWQLYFDHNETTINNNNNNNNANIISPIICEKMPSFETIKMNYHSDLKIVALPYGSNKYSFRIIEVWDYWWDDYDDGNDKEFLDGESSLDEVEYRNVRRQYNNPNTIFLDYNINLNKFEITNKLSLVNWDGFILHYEDLFVSNNGQYLLPFCKSEGFGVCRVDSGLTKVESHKKIKDYDDVKGPFYKECKEDLDFYVSLSNDNKITTLYKQY